MYQIDNKIRMLHFDLELTKACNMRCDYCFEEKEPKQFQKVGLFIRRITEVLESEWFNNNYDLLNINFWGGEPTLEGGIINNIVSYFKNDSRVRFFIFSNGYNLQRVKFTLQKYKNITVKGNHPKICIQISYDGPHIHDLHRVDKQGNGTSFQVIESIAWLDNNKIPYVIKPVIHTSDFRFLPLAYEYIKKLTYEDNPTFFKSQNYNPTIEYYRCEEDNEETVKQNLYELRKSLIEIAAQELIDIKENKHRPFFSWFHNNKAICSAGVHYFAINVDGTVFPCHGCMYIDKKSYWIVSNIESEVFKKDIEYWSMNHEKYTKYLPSECKNCDTNFCMKCNVVKFENSKKTKYIDRWIDYTNQSNLCMYFKEIGKVSKVFHKKMRKG